jgi:hypothetical protein
MTTLEDKRIQLRNDRGEDWADQESFLLRERNYIRNRDDRTYKDFIQRFLGGETFRAAMQSKSLTDFPGSVLPPI